MPYILSVGLSVHLASATCSSFIHWKIAFGICGFTAQCLFSCPFSSDLYISTCPHHLTQDIYLLQPPNCTQIGQATSRPTLPWVQLFCHSLLKASWALVPQKRLSHQIQPLSSALTGAPWLSLILPAQELWSCGTGSPSPDNPVV